MTSDSSNIRPFRFVLFFLLLLVLPASVTAWVVIVSLFEPTEIHQTDARPLDVAVADINNDGFIDVLTANRDGRSVSVFMGNGDGTLTAINKIETELGATSLALADMDADEMIDVVVSLCNMGCTSNVIGIFRGLGDGRFEDGVIIGVEGVPYNIAVADLNQDEIPDIAASDYPGNRLMVLLSNPATQWSYNEISLFTGRKPIALLIDDLNNDDLPDLISSDHGSDSSSVFLASGDGEFSERIEVETGNLPYAIALDFIDEDDFLDLAVAHSDSPGKVTLHVGNGDGSFTPVDEFEVGDRLIFIDTEDFDEDGRRDIIVTHNKAKYASVYLNVGAGDDYDGGSAYFDDRDVRVIAENRIYSAAVTNLNDDPYPDLVTVDYDESTLSVSRGTMPGQGPVPQEELQRLP